MLEQTSEAIVAFDATGVLVYVNPAAGTLLHYTVDAVVGTNVIDLIHPSEVRRVATVISGVTAGARPRPGLIRLRRGDGGWKLLEVSPSPVLLPAPPDGPGDLTMVVIRDNALQEAHWSFLAALSSGEPFHECLEVLARGLSSRADGQLGINYEAGGRRLVAGSLPAPMVGVIDGRLDRSEATPWGMSLKTGDPAWSLVDALPTELRRFAAARGAAACVVVPVPDPAGESPAFLVQWPEEASIAPLLVEALIRRPKEALLLALDRRNAMKRLEHLAHHDGLTGLINRERFLEMLTELSIEGDPYGVCYIDLDRFKPVNDSLGHMVGDHVLAACAKRLQHLSRPGDVVARVGGDEFALACPGMSDADLEAFAERIVLALRSPLHVDGHLVEVGASVGCLVAEPGHGADSVLAAADAALYRAKRSGRSTWIRDDGTPLAIERPS
ncbi:MAG TPA: diguanylate cyclase [Ilumatobacteraceae bacterium]